MTHKPCIDCENNYVAKEKNAAWVRLGSGDLYVIGCLKHIELLQQRLKVGKEFYNGQPSETGEEREDISS